MLVKHVPGRKHRPSSRRFSTRSKMVTPKGVWRTYADFLCLVLLASYLIFIPGGLPGFGIVAIALVLKLSTVPRLETVGIYMLLFGMKTFGLVSIVFGHPGIGGKIAFIIGVTVLVFTTSFGKTLFNLRLPFIYFLWFFTVIYWAYLDGPQTLYCDNKLSKSIIFGILFLVAFYYLLNSRVVDWLQLGQLGVLSALVILTVSIIAMPHLKPNSMLDIGAIRTQFDLKDLFEFRNLLGGVAVLSFALLLAATPDRFLTRLSLLNLLIYSSAAFIILAWGGSRLPLATAIAIVVSMLLVKPLYRKRYTIVTIGIGAVIFGLLLYGLSQHLQFISSAFDSSQSYSQRFNRTINWEAGLRRFFEKPIWGHGIGGYYIKGFSFPGEGTYAHNLVLELLVETGIVRTLLILLPLFFLYNPLGSYFYARRANNGGAVFPLLLVLFLQSMISFDLSANIGFFSMVGAIAASSKKKRKKSVKDRQKQFDWRKKRLLPLASFTPPSTNPNHKTHL